MLKATVLALLGLQVGQVADLGSSARQLSGVFAWAPRQLEKQQSSVQRVRGHMRGVCVWPSILAAGMGVCGLSKYGDCLFVLVDYWQLISW